MDIAVVVGANGFIGSVLVDKLIEGGFDVYAIYNNNRSRINQKAHLCTSNEFFNSGIIPNFIFHLTGNYATTYRDLLALNQELYKYTMKFRSTKFIYISSANVYGNAAGTISENTPFDNPSRYAKSKLAGEFIVESLDNYAIVRLAYVYGPGMTNTSFIPSIIKSAKENGKIVLFGSGEREQDYVYVDDAVDFCVAAAYRDYNDIYLGATGTSVSNLDIANKIREFVNCELIFKGTETGQSFYFNSSISGNKLSWVPKISVEQGIKNILV